MNKKDLRKKVKNILSTFSKEQIKSKSLFVSKNLKSLTQKLYFKNSLIGHLGVYSPMQQEVLWFLDYESSDHLYAVAHMLPEGMMEFHPIDLVHIKSGEIGLELDEHMKSQIVTPDVIVIPGLAFDKSGDRLGRGKGYFDKFLCNYKGIKVGVCFEEQLCESIPTEKHDVRLDYLVTEKKVYKITEN